MITKFILFENNNLKSGDYVIVDLKDDDINKRGDAININLVIGKFCGKNYDPKNRVSYIVKYSASGIFKNGYRIYVNEDDIKFSSKSKEQLEKILSDILAAKKYNL